jgi:mRNA-degrading endonuclease HigB of HigAB toxin-antitoxin module
MEKQQEQYFVQYLFDKHHMLRTGGKSIVTKYPEADTVLNHLYNILENIVWRDPHRVQLVAVQRGRQL